MDLDSGRVLIKEEEHHKRPPACLVKLATAIVALQSIEKYQMDPHYQITVPVSAAQIPGGNPLGLKPGDKISMRVAIISMLVASDHRSAFTVAHYIGGSITPNAKEKDFERHFVKQMNQLAKSLGMKRTRFMSSYGLEREGKVSKSTAVDMAILAKEALNHKLIESVVAKKEVILQFKQNDRKLKIKIKNTHKLVYNHGYQGLKGGRSRFSKGCLITRYKDGGVDLLCVVLGSSYREDDTQSHINQAFLNFNRLNKS